MAFGITDWLVICTGNAELHDLQARVRKFVDRGAADLFAQEEAARGFYSVICIAQVADRYTNRLVVEHG